MWKKAAQVEESVRGLICDKSISKNENQSGKTQCWELLALRKRHETEWEVANNEMLSFCLGLTRMDRIKKEFRQGNSACRICGS